MLPELLCSYDSVSRKERRGNCAVAWFASARFLPVREGGYEVFEETEELHHMGGKFQWAHFLSTLQ